MAAHSGIDPLSSGRQPGTHPSTSMRRVWCIPVVSSHTLRCFKPALPPGQLGMRCSIELAAAVGVEPTMPGSEPGALGLLATPQFESIGFGQTARGSNPSLWIESPLTSPEVERFRVAEAGSSRTPKAALPQLTPFSRRAPSPIGLRFHDLEVGARIERARHR